MQQLLEVVRIRFAGRPLLLTLGVLVVLLVVKRGLARTGRLQLSPLLGAITVPICLAALASYVAIAVWYSIEPHFFDNAEPTMVAVGWLFHVGLPIYPSPDAAERYAHIYGPLAFMIHGAVQGLIGPSIVVSKGLGATAGILALGLTYLAVRRRVEQERAIVLTGLAALMLLAFRHYSFWVRAEPLQLLAVSCALFAVTVSRGALAAIVVGVATGVLVNLKLTSPLYVLPVFAMLQARAGWGRTVLAATTGLVVAAAPFVAFSNVSLVNYLAWLRYSADTGLVLLTLRQNLEWALYFSLPILVAGYALPRDRRPADLEWRNTMLALAAGVIGVVIAASKPGAGPYHLIPFIPIIVYLVARQLGENRLDLSAADPIVAPGAMAFILVALIVAVVQQASLLRTMIERRQFADVEDIQAFASTHEGVIDMGYGASEALTLERPILVFRNNSYFIDQPAIREHQLQGLTLPQATIDALGNCRVNYWLIPRGDPPFSGRNSYPKVQLEPLYPESFRQTFLATHRHVATTAYYDVWQCHAGGGK